MYNQNLVNLCKSLVNDSIRNRSQIRTNFGQSETPVYLKFKSVANSCSFNFVTPLKTIPFNELVYQISHDGKYHKCHCGKPTRFQSVSKGYAMYCSIDCKKTDPQFISKVKAGQVNRTDEEKAETANKRKQTNLEKYGVEYTMHNQDLVEKFKESRKK